MSGQGGHVVTVTVTHGDRGVHTGRESIDFQRFSLPTTNLMRFSRQIKRELLLEIDKVSIESSLKHDRLTTRQTNIKPKVCFHCGALVQKLEDTTGVRLIK